MSEQDELDEATPDEQARIEAATSAIDSADELAVMPLVHRESGERELFLVAVRSDEAGAEVEPVGRLCDADEVSEEYEVPEPLATE